MSNFTFFHNVFYAICILKYFNSHILTAAVFSFFEFGKSQNDVLGNGLKLVLETFSLFLPISLPYEGQISYLGIF